MMQNYSEDRFAAHAQRQMCIDSRPDGAGAERSEGVTRRAMGHEHARQRRKQRKRAEKGQRKGKEVAVAWHALRASKRKRAQQKSG